MDHPKKNILDSSKIVIIMLQNKIVLEQYRTSMFGLYRKILNIASLENTDRNQKSLESYSYIMSFCKHVEAKVSLVPYSVNYTVKTG